MDIYTPAFMLSTVIICGLYGRLAFSPARILTLSNSEFYGLLAAAVAMMYVAWDGVSIFMLVPFAGVALIFYWLPVQVEKRYCGFIVTGCQVGINKVTHTVYWPKALGHRKYGFTDGCLFGLVPWQRYVNNVEYVFHGEVYPTMGALTAKRPGLAAEAELALLRAL